MKRVQVTEEELAILEGLRHERAVWNQALESVLLVLNQQKALEDLDRVSGELILQSLTSKVLDLRK